MLLLTHVHYTSAERSSTWRRITAGGEARRGDDGLRISRGTASARCRSHLNERRRGAGGRLRLQISERRPGRAGLPLRRRASAGRTALAAARLDGPCRALRLHRRLPPGPGHRPLPRRHPADPRPRRAGSGARRVRRRHHGAGSGPSRRAMFDVFVGLVGGALPGVRAASPRAARTQRGSHIIFAPSPMPSRSARR